MFAIARNNFGRAGQSVLARRLESTLKDSRTARRAKLGESGGPKKPFFTKNKIIAFTTIGALSYVTYDIKQNPKGIIGSLYYGSIVESVFKDIYEFTTGQVSTIFEPSSDKLLPDWPTAPCYGNIPPGTPAPPLLVVDLEKTLIGSVYDPTHGWRHVKRPGLDKFINALSNYYEIVIFSENDIGVAQDILMAIDPENKCHKLGQAAAEMRGVHVLKRLDLMNRDISRIILIDDNPESFQLFPRNTLQVKPFTDINDKTDTVLVDIIPLLQAIVHEDIKDFRQTFDSLGTHDAEEATVEYRMRVSQKKAMEHARRNKGLGGMIRGPKPEEQMDDGFIQSSVLSPKDIVGADPSGSHGLPVGHSGGMPEKKTGVQFDHTGKKIEEPKVPATRKKGALFAYLDESEKNKAEEQQRKQEKLNELFMQRQLAKQQAEQQQQTAQPQAQQQP